MKEKIMARLDRLEDAIRHGMSVPHVAMRINDGPIVWNGVEYADEESLNSAVRSILGEFTKPIVIIHQRSDFTVNEGKV